MKVFGRSKCADNPRSYDDFVLSGIFKNIKLIVVVFLRFNVRRPFAPRRVSATN